MKITPRLSKNKEEKEMTLYVMAKKWDSEQEKQVWYKAGEFTSYANAAIFQHAYEEHYSAKAVLISEENLIAGKLTGF